MTERPIKLAPKCDERLEVWDRDLKICRTDFKKLGYEDAKEGNMKFNEGEFLKDYKDDIDWYSDLDFFGRQYARGFKVLNEGFWYNTSVLWLAERLAQDMVKLSKERGIDKYDNVGQIVNDFENLWVLGYGEYINEKISKKIKFKRKG